MRSYRSYPATISVRPARSTTRNTRSVPTPSAAYGGRKSRKLSDRPLRTARASTSGNNASDSGDEWTTQSPLRNVGAKPWFHVGAQEHVSLGAHVRSVPTTPVRPRPPPYALAWIVALAFALRVAVLPFHGYQHDLTIFVGWAHILMAYGTHGLYGRPEPVTHTALNYPPGYALQLLAVTGVARLLLPHAGTHGDALLGGLLKVPPILADLGSVVLAYAIVRRWRGDRAALGAAAIAALGPWTWPVSAFWGQVDSTCSVLLVLALWLALEDRFTAAWLALVAGILVKPFPIVVLPLLVALQLRREGVSLRLAAGPAAGAALAYCASLPFAPNAAPLATMGWLARQYTSGQGLFPMTSVNAYNVWLVASPPVPDGRRAFGLSLQTWGWLAFGAFDAAVTLAFWRRFGRERNRTAGEQLVTLAWFVATLGLFVLATRMHERYLIFALAFAPMLFWCGAWQRLAVVVLSLTFTANVGLDLIYKHVREIVLLTRTLSLVNVATLVAEAAALRAVKPP
jgi:Gpi18-like mannosyltransferase